MVTWLTIDRGNNLLATDDGCSISTLEVYEVASKPMHHT